MLRDGEHDLVVGLEVVGAPGRGDQVDALGGAADEDDFTRIRRIDESCDLLTGGGETIGGAAGQRMHA